MAFANIKGDCSNFSVHDEYSPAPYTTLICAKTLFRCIPDSCYTYQTLYKYCCFIDGRCSKELNLLRCRVKN